MAARWVAPHTCGKPSAQNTLPGVNSRVTRERTLGMIASGAAHGAALQVRAALS